MEQNQDTWKENSIAYWVAEFDFIQIHAIFYKKLGVFFFFIGRIFIQLRGHRKPGPEEEPAIRSVVISCNTCKFHAFITICYMEIYLTFDEMGHDI